MNDQNRFKRFASALANWSGDRCELLSSGRVVVFANEFSPAQRFSDVQEAIDHFAYAFKV